MPTKPARAAKQSHPARKKAARKATKASSPTSRKREAKADRLAATPPVEAPSPVPADPLAPAPVHREPSGSAEPVAFALAAVSFTVAAASFVLFSTGHDALDSRSPDVAQARIMYGLVVLLGLAGAAAAFFAAPDRWRGRFAMAVPGALLIALLAHGYAGVFATAPHSYGVEASEEPPMPALAGILLVVGVPLLVWCIVALATAHHPGRSPRLGGAIATVFALSVVWGLGLAGGWEAVSVESRADEAREAWAAWDAYEDSLRRSHSSDIPALGTVATLAAVLLAGALWVSRHRPPGPPRLS